MSEIRENVQNILDRALGAAQRAGTPDLTVVAASKMNDAARVREAFDAGIRVFGENRVQELTAKLAANAYEGAAVHFIGHLQRNKVKNVVGRVDLIQSVDSLELAGLIGGQAGKLGIVQDALIEVNIGGEAQKSGADPAALPEILENVGKIPGIRVLGLMTIPPVDAKKENTVHYFEQMRNLFVDMSAKKYDNVTMRFLSMGMSADFEEAILSGANMVRVGTAIFGARHYL